MPQGCNWDAVHECLAGESLLIIIRWNYQADATQAWEFHTTLSHWVSWDFCALCQLVIRAGSLFLFFCFFDKVTLQDCSMWQVASYHLKYSRSAPNRLCLLTMLCYFLGPPFQSFFWLSVMSAHVLNSHPFCRLYSFCRAKNRERILFT